MRPLMPPLTIVNRRRWGTKRAAKKKPGLTAAKLEGLSERELVQLR